MIFPLIAISILLNGVFCYESTLKRVVLIHRHGDRAPVETYPLDPYGNETKYWPDGWGQLTKQGKERMYGVGQYLAGRYKGFLGQSPREVYIRSAGSDRCLESAQLLLAGLYPPVDRWQWNDGLGKSWQPFPIQSMPHEDDPMLNAFSTCKNAFNELFRVFSTPEFTKLLDSNEKFFEQLSNLTGQKSLDFIKAEELYDALFIEKHNNYTLPSWVTQEIYTKLQEIATKLFYYESLTKKIQRFRAGVLLKELIQRFTENETDGKRLYIYSTHDANLSVFLSAINAYNNMLPPFGSTIIMELHQAKDPFIKTYYLNQTETRSPFELRLNDCAKDGSELCTVNQFKQSVQDLIPDNWEEECNK